MQVGNLELVKKGSQVRLYFKNRPATPQGYYKQQFDSTQTRIFYKALVELTDKPVKHDDKPYNDEISTYAQEVERTLSIGGYKGCLKIDLICYTDDTDDDWIGLSPKRIAKLAGMIYPYI